MKRIYRLLLIATLTLTSASAAGALTGYPFQDETLHYSVNWPSGLSLGDATLTAHRTSSGWDLGMTLDAGIPAFPISDRFHSTTTAEGCSKEFERDTAHASKRGHEKTVFDYPTGVAHRTTLVDGGGTTDLAISNCARDALAFVYYTRRELGQGRVPPSQDVFFGPIYSARLEYTGAQTIPVGDKPTVTDRVVARVRGPASEFQIEMYFARDAARTPLSIRIPVAVGKLSLELAP
jgi:hypothetical protein